MQGAQGSTGAGKVVVAFVCASEGRVEHCFGQTADALLGNGCTLTKGSDDVDALESASGHELDKLCGVIFLGDFQLVGSEQAAFLGDVKDIERGVLVEQGSHGGGEAPCCGDGGGEVVTFGLGEKAPVCYCRCGSHDT